MATREFDKKFITLQKEALYNVLEYVDYSKEIDCVYLYISLEYEPMYLVFLKINNHISFQHKLNEFSIKDKFDVSEEHQTTLLQNGNAIASQIKKCFVEDDREVPTNLKITYEPKTRKFECKIGYEKMLDYESMVDEVTIYFRWYKALGGILEAWQKV